MSSTLQTPSGMKTQPAPSKPTPYSKGTASNSSFDTHHTRKDYESYIEADLEGTCKIGFDKFLEIAFAFESTPELNDEFKAIASSDDFQKHLSEYKKQSREVKRYGPFNNLANHVNKELALKFPPGKEAEGPIVFCRSDGSKIKGSPAIRFPDCVVVSEKASQQGRVGLENQLEDPKGVPFFWSDLLAFVEFKKKSRSNTQPTQNDDPFAPEPTSSGIAPAVASISSGTTSASSSTSLTVDQPSTSGNSGSSQKRRGEDIEATPRKRTKEGINSVQVQCASYALEMLSYGGLRTHVISALVTDTELQLLYYDRSLPVKSERIDFSEEPIRFVAFIYCLQRATPSQRGRLSNIAVGINPLATLKTPKAVADASSSASEGQPDELLELTPHLLCGAILTLKDGTQLRLGELVFIQHALIGRGTCVVRAEVIGPCPQGWGGKKIVVKFSFTPKTRDSEGIILKEIVKIAKSDKMKAGDTTSNSDIMEDTDTTKDHEKPNHRWVLDHLPEVLRYEALKVTNDVQSRLSKHLTKMQVPYEDRVLQILVMTELFPLTKLTTSDELVPVIKDIFKCYRWLYEHAKVIHRDISLNNLMYRKANGRICGVLSDYDLSLFYNKPKAGPSSKQRTGTRPYMAIDLLDPTPTKHLYRHDLESLFYVIVVLVTRYDKGKEVVGSPLQRWFQEPPIKLREVKESFLRRPPPKPTSAFQNLHPLLLQMVNMFRIGYHARDDHIFAASFTSMGKHPKTTSVDQAVLDSNFNDETLGGNVDFDKFQTILNTATSA